MTPYPRMILTAVAMVIISSTAAFAASSQTACSAHYADGQPPVFTNPNFAAGTRELCNEAYANMHSRKTRTPIWGAEHLTRAHLLQAKSLRRVNSFRADERLPSADRSELQDFARSGFDRGHICPSADAFSSTSQNETFYLSNMIPQDPNNNRNLHEGIETVTRAEAKKRGDLFVVTGTLYSGKNLRSLNNRVIVPTGIYKCLYDPNSHETGCYVENNAPGMAYQVESVSAVGKLAGVNIFPSVSDSIKSKPMRLPEPRPFHKDGL